MGSLSMSISNDRVYPMLPAVALSIVLASVACPPWSNSFTTFSAKPELVTINTEASLVDIAHSMVQSSWGMNTDFNAVFSKLILPAAKANKLNPEDMVKKLLVFADVQFDQSLVQGATRKTFKMKHQKVKDEFEAAGYELPEIVY